MNDAKKTESVDHPLTAEIKDHKLIISIGVGQLATAAFFGHEILGEGDVIVDVDAFAQDMLRRLEQEDDIGATHIERMFDKGAAEVLDQGDCYKSVRFAGEAEPVDTDRALHLINPHVAAKLRLKHAGAGGAS